MGDTNILKEDILVIKRTEIDMLSGSTLDEIGEAFSWRGRIFRRVYPHAEGYVKDLFTCGVLNELIEKDLFIPTWIARDVIFEDESILIEQKKITPMIYSAEYSFLMRKEIALTIIKINQVLFKYGFELMDPHYRNIAFDGCLPKYLDIGSIVKVDKFRTAFHGINCFEKNIYYPLLGYVRHKNMRPAMEAFLRCNGGIDDYGELGWIVHPVLGGCFRYFYVLRGLYRKSWPYMCGQSFGPNTSRIKKWVVKVAGIFLIPHNKDCAKQKKYLKIVSYQYKKYFKKIEGITINIQERWSNYHDEYYDGKKLTKRQERIIDIINQLDCESCLEIAGNTGLMCREMICRNSIKRAICTDYDSGAIDKGFELNRNSVNNGRLTFAVMNILDSCEYGKQSKAERMKSDVVLVMAVTHHLLLTQKVKLSRLVEIISQYTKKFLLIEFMPRGLWTETIYVPTPEWYTLEWFEDELKIKFNILLVERLEKNRILLLCKVKE